MLLLATWMAMLSLPVYGEGAQQRETDLEFLRSLGERLNVAEARLNSLETRVSRAVQAQPRQPLPQAATTGSGLPAPARVSQRLRHKERAVSANEDDLGRIKARFPVLRDKIARARKSLLAHELTHAPQAGGESSGHAMVKQIAGAVSNMESRLDGLAADIDSQAQYRARE